MASTPYETMNADALLPDDVLDVVLEDLKDSKSRRITFRENPDRPTKTEQLLPSRTRRLVRKHLRRADLPVRLYFSIRDEDTRVGRPALPFREELLDLIKAGHRIETVAAYFGVHPQTPKNWGAHQPARDVLRRLPEDDEEQLNDLVAIGVDHMADMLDVEPHVALFAGRWGVRVDEAREQLARIGMVALDVEKSA